MELADQPRLDFIIDLVYCIASSRIDSVFKGNGNEIVLKKPKMRG
jgi:hypothetical protein